MLSFTDRALDRSVVLGYSRLGFAARARQWSGDDPAPGALTGRTLVVTGATSGIGAAIADAVAQLGGHPVLVGRDRARAEAVRSSMLARHPGSAASVELSDLSDPEQVRDLAARLAKYNVDSLIHNAGVMPKNRADSAGGHELSLATHVLGPILLTDLMTDQLAESGDARVIFVSSGGMYTAKLPVRDIDYRDGHYRGARAYARSKRIQTALLPILAERWACSGVIVAAMHPGWVDTPGVNESLPWFSAVTAPALRNPEEGADTAVWLAATSTRLPSGQFWHDRKTRPLHYLRGTRFSEAERQSVWKSVCAATGISESGTPSAE